MDIKMFLDKIQTAINMAEHALQSGQDRHFRTKEKTVSSEQFYEWRSFSLSMLKTINKMNDLYFKEFNEKTSKVTYIEPAMKRGLGVLKALKMELTTYPIEEIVKKEGNDNLTNIFERFHKVVRQIRRRYNSRETIDVKDEYDVQDLLHSILTLYFDDIRAEEWTPSYAGSSSRMDFLLKEIETVVEVKMTRKGLKDKEVGIQLIEDITKYKTHPNCKTLICFVYDPDGYIQNSAGIESDLNESGEEGFTVKVYVRPE